MVLLDSREIRETLVPPDRLASPDSLDQRETMAWLGKLAKQDHPDNQSVSHHLLLFQFA